MKHEPQGRTLSLGLAMIGALALGATFVQPASSGSGAEVAVVFAPTGPSRQVHKAVIGELSKVRKSIDVACFQFTSTPLARTLATLSKRCRVRVLLDHRSAFGTKVSQHKFLISKGVQVRYVKLPGKGYMAPKFHHKFAVLDGREVLTGSYNWTILADEKNYENLVVIRDKNVAKKFAAEFERIWNDKEVITLPK